MEQERPDVPARLFPVLRELKSGAHNHTIAERLDLREHTVEKYVSELLAIFQCDGRGELIARAASGQFDDYS